MSMFIRRTAQAAAQLRRQIHTSSAFCKRRPHEAVDAPETTRGSIQEVKQDLWQKQFVLDNFEIPGKYQKFFTGRMRKREAQRLDRRINGPPQTDELMRIAARKMVTDEKTQEKKMDMLGSHILRILEEHLASDELPVRQLSLQHWRITDVLVSFNLKTAVCCYKVTSQGKRVDGSKAHEIRGIIRESADYLNAIVNQELAKGASKRIGAPHYVRVKFSTSTKASDIMERIEAELRENAEM